MRKLPQGLRQGLSGYIKVKAAIRRLGKRAAENTALSGAVAMDSHQFTAR
jgi:hypothetical protein